MNHTSFGKKYSIFFDQVMVNKPISSVVAQMISYDLIFDKPQLLKQNNFFAIADQKKVFKRFPTPWDGIESGVQKIIQDPNFVAFKVGTLKANPIKQVQKIRFILGLST